MPRLFRLVHGGPDIETTRLIAEAKRRLRRHDIRAIAMVLVEPNGFVTTAWSGDDAGHHHQLASGIETLRHRYYAKANR